MKIPIGKIIRAGRGAAGLFLIGALLSATAPARKELPDSQRELTPAQKENEQRKETVRKALREGRLKLTPARYFREDRP